MTVTDEEVLLGMALVPAGSLNGTPIGTPPDDMVGVRLYLPPNASITFTVAAAQPTAAPAITFTTPVSSVASNWDEPLRGRMIFVVSTSGTPLFRWV